MKKWYKNCWIWLIAITVILCIMLFSILMVHNFTFIKILTSSTFWSIVGIVAATVTSIVTHMIIVKRDKRINTIAALSKIRLDYPDLSSCLAANCRTGKELQRKRITYLRAMEFFCVGIINNVYDIEIVNEMSGHFLTTQYNSWCKEFAVSRIKNGWEYRTYFTVMEKLIKIQKGDN